MPKCPACDADIPVGQLVCAACAASLADEGVVPTDVVDRAVASRPTGLALIWSGWLVVAIGFALAIWGYSARSPSSVIEADIARMERSAMLLTLSSDALWAGFLMLLAGCIVRAIWFLPRDETKVSFRPGSRP